MRCGSRSPGGGRRVLVRPVNSSRRRRVARQTAPRVVPPDGRSPGLLPDADGSSGSGRPDRPGASSGHRGHVRGDGDDRPGSGRPPATGHAVGALRAGRSGRARRTAGPGRRPAGDRHQLGAVCGPPPARRSRGAARRRGRDAGDLGRLPLACGGRPDRAAAAARRAGRRPGHRRHRPGGADPVDVRGDRDAPPRGAGQLRAGRPVGRGERRYQRTGPGHAPGRCRERPFGRALQRPHPRLDLLGGAGARPGDRPPAGRAGPVDDLGPRAPDGHRDRGRLRPPAGAGVARAARGTLVLRVLGRAEAFLGGVRLRLTRRQIEILALLVLHPDGLSLDALHAHLYGDRSVSPATLKAEVSHLRGIVGGAIASRPYRLTVPVALDAAEVEAALRAGRLFDAVASYRGYLLAGTDAPGLLEYGNYLAVAVREALLARPDPQAVLRYVEAVPHDVDVLERAVRALGGTPHPARPLLLARLRTAYEL